MLQLLFELMHWLTSVWVPMSSHYPNHRALLQSVRTRVLSCLLLLHDLHIDWRLSSVWSGMPPVSDGGLMWSMVQSLPSSSLWHVMQRGSSIVLAYALASRHSLESCQSLIVVLLVLSVRLGLRALLGS